MPCCQATHHEQVIDRKTSLTPYLLPVSNGVINMYDVIYMNGGGATQFRPGRHIDWQGLLGFVGLVAAPIVFMLLVFSVNAA